MLQMQKDPVEFSGRHQSAGEHAALEQKDQHLSVGDKGTWMDMVLLVGCMLYDNAKNTRLDMVVRGWVHVEIRMHMSKNSCGRSHRCRIICKKECLMRTLSSEPRENDATAGPGPSNRVTGSCIAGQQ